jgi:CheY-like chemotaxis protein
MYRPHSRSRPRLSRLPTNDSLHLKLRKRTAFYHPHGSRGKSLTARSQLLYVLIILQMPVMDGLTCVRRIREYEATGQIISHIPVIAITANARSEQINIAMEAGMDTVVTKPFRIPDLVPRMQSLLSEYPAK